MAAQRKKRSRRVRNRAARVWKPDSAPAMRRYLLMFVAAAAIFFGVYWTTEATGKFQNVNVFNAVLSGTLLRAVGVETHRFATVLQFRSSGMEIISECSGIYVAILFAAGVVAFPATWRARTYGLLLGLGAIFAINVIRLVTVGIVIAYRESLFPFVHEYLWQVLFILVVAALYVLWIDKLAARSHREREAAS